MVISFVNSIPETITLHDCYYLITAQYGEFESTSSESLIISTGFLPLAADDLRQLKNPVGTWNIVSINVLGMREKKVVALFYNRLFELLNLLSLFCNDRHTCCYKPSKSQQKQFIICLRSNGIGKVLVRKDFHSCFS